MIDISVFRNIILTANPTYTINFAREKEPDFHTIATLPVIYVGYANIDSKNPSIPLESTIFNSHGEDLVQTFEVQIVSELASFRTIWINVYKSLIGVNPVAAEANRTGFTYAQGGVMGLSNGLLWHLDRWKIGFPTVNVVI